MEVISVIVPVFNVESFLNQCISSIVRQEYRDLEIILVDDGSTDRSPQICDEWAKKDKRIKVIHTQNGGGGKARNIALDIARGEFIGFVDSDDYIASDFYKHLLKLITNETDIAECSYLETDGDNAQFANPNNCMIMKYTAVEAMKENIEDRFFRQLIWNKLYRRSVIDDIKFPEGKKIDDEYWTYQVIGNARELIRSNAKLYAYRQQENSVMHSLKPDNRLQALEAKTKRHDYICYHFPELLGKSLNNLWFSCIYQGQFVLRFMKRQERKEALNYIKKVLNKYPVDAHTKSGIRLTEKLWLNMAEFSFVFTCFLRNVLKIGL
ncbi:MAG: glycosyltransferase [Sellimonas sp.]|uniref:glycosyltransferase n=1 Tax=Sellimonas sp. TaxID=2021466 RepID=UPI0039A19EAD